MVERLEYGSEEPMSALTAMDSARQEAYADPEFYRSVFSQKGSSSAGSYWYNQIGSGYTGQDDAIITNGSNHPDSGIFLHDPLFDAPRPNINAQTPTRDSSLDGRRGSLPRVNPNIYDPPVDPVNRPDQDSNYPRLTPEEAPPKNPEEWWPGGGTLRADAGSESGDLSGFADSSLDYASDDSWSGADYAYINGDSGGFYIATDFF